jgi:hypothetical protein
VGVYAVTSLSSARINTVPSRQEVRVACPVQGEEVVRGSLRNDWWAYLPELGGYMSNHLLRVVGQPAAGRRSPLCG